MSFLALVFPIISGLFFLASFFLVEHIKTKKQLAIISTSMAFIVMIGIVFLDLLQEIIESVLVIDWARGYKILFVILVSFLGIGILKVLDIFVPHHNHHHKQNEKNIKEHQGHLFHIGIITTVSLLIHNLIEGISIYIIGLESITGGLLMAIGVGLHNFPLGTQIASSIDNNKKSKLIMLLLVLSSFIAPLFIVLFNIRISNVVMLFLMCLSFGMILYIALFELLREIFNYRKQKEIIYGMILGIIIVLLMNIIA